MSDSFWTTCVLVTFLPPCAYLAYRFVLPAWLAAVRFISTWLEEV